jgi:hypothetical protein
VTGVDFARAPSNWRNKLKNADLQADLQVNDATKLRDIRSV